MAKAYPQLAVARPKWLKEFKTKPEVCAGTCVCIASGLAKELRGRYFDCEHDMETTLKYANEVLSQGKNELVVEFIGGLPNDGGIAKNYGKI